MALRSSSWSLLLAGVVGLAVGALALLRSTHAERAVEEARATLGRAETQELLALTAMDTVEREDQRQRVDGRAQLDPLREDPRVRTHCYIHVPHRRGLAVARECLENPLAKGCGI